MLSAQQLRRVLACFFLLTYLVLLAITWGGFDFASARQQGLPILSFALVVWLTYGVIYLLPALLLTWLLGKLAHRRRAAANKIVMYPVAVLSTALTTLFFYANAKLFTLYGMFINSFVINLVTTRGGLESLGASNASNATFAVIALAFILLQVALLAGSLRICGKSNEPRYLTGRVLATLMIVFVVTTVGERFVYAYATATGVTSIASLAMQVPYYSGLSARGLLSKFGVKVEREKTFQLAQGNLNYPLNPLRVDKPSKPLNIVWLVSESWRADTLDAEVMPSTWEFAQTAQRFTRNFSGGNGTRVGVFSMFTGIPGSYWFPMLAERKGAPIVDVLKEQNYQMSFYTAPNSPTRNLTRRFSARFRLSNCTRYPAARPGGRRTSRTSRTCLSSSIRAIRAGRFSPSCSSSRRTRVTIFRRKASFASHILTTSTTSPSAVTSWRIWRRRSRIATSTRFIISTASSAGFSTT